MFFWSGMNDPNFDKQDTLPDATPDQRIKAAFDVPRVIGPYKIESLLEKGGMSLVYLGTHPETLDPVTIKVLSPKFLSNKEMVERFLKEAEIIALADHPNIVKLYGYGEWEGGLYIAMEFIQGVSLRQYLQHNSISLKRALEMILETAYALCHLHTHSIIHRDLKLENLLVNEAGQIKVIDFGIAQLLQDEGVGAPELQQRFLGTPIYMSPEQRENPENVSYPSDIYSLGIIAYELVLGKLSHGRIHLSLMPKGLQKILAKALQPRPEDRYQDIVDFISDISAYLNSATLQKEKKEGDPLSELSEHLQQAQAALTPSQVPAWSGIELGVIYQKGLQSAGIYYDFFSLPDDKYGIIIMEPSIKTADGLIYLAVLRGMIKALVQLAPNPAECVTMLNHVLEKDSLNQVFTLSYLVLDPKKNNLHFISCGYGSIWLFPAQSESPKKLSADNIALGIDKDASFQELVHPWELGDSIIMSSLLFPDTQIQEEKSFLEEHYRDALIETRNLPSQKQVETLLRKAKASSSKGSEKSPYAVISIRRQERIQ